MNKLLALVVVLLSGLYILNPTIGIFEFIPDNIPFVGNLDQAAATAILIWGLRQLGFMKK